MKIPTTFIPEKKLENKIEFLLKEKPLPQINKNEIPSYALQEKGDYLMMGEGSFHNAPNNRKIEHAKFYFSLQGKEHKLYIDGDTTKIDEQLVDLESMMIFYLFEIALTSFYEHEYGHQKSWESDMVYFTKKVYNELVKIVDKSIV